MSHRRPRSLWGKERLAFTKFSDETILDMIPLFEDCILKEIALKLTQGCRSCALLYEIKSPYFECGIARKLVRRDAGCKSADKFPNKCVSVFGKYDTEPCQQFSFDNLLNSEYFRLFLEELVFFVQIELARIAVANRDVDNLIVELLKEEPYLSDDADDGMIIYDVVDFVNGETVAFDMESIRKMLFANRPAPTLHEIRDANAAFVSQSVTMVEYVSEKVKQALKVDSVGDFGSCNAYRSPLMW